MEESITTKESAAEDIGTSKESVAEDFGTTKESATEDVVTGKESANTPEPSFYGRIEKQFDLKKDDIRSCSVLSLAFIGDNVYDLVVRSVLLSERNGKVNDLHREKSRLVQAKTQARIAEYLMKENLLSKEEQDYYRCGKNAKTGNHAKNADISDYHKATGFEAVMGFLYLTGQEQRLLELCKLSIEAYRNGICQ